MRKRKFNVIDGKKKMVVEYRKRNMIDLEYYLTN